MITDGRIPWALSSNRFRCTISNMEVRGFFFSCWIIVAFKARDYFLITDTFFHFFGLGNYDI